MLERQTCVTAAVNRSNGLRSVLEYGHSGRRKCTLLCLPKQPSCVLMRALGPVSGCQGRVGDQVPEDQRRQSGTASWKLDRRAHCPSVQRRTSSSQHIMSGHMLLGRQMAHARPVAPTHPTSRGQLPRTVARSVACLSSSAVSPIQQGGHRLQTQLGCSAITSGAHMQCCHLSSG
jgi:hypothetical protein